MSDAGRIGSQSPSFADEPLGSEVGGPSHPYGQYAQHGSNGAEAFDEAISNEAARPLPQPYVGSGDARSDGFVDQLPTYSEQTQHGEAPLDPEADAAYNRAPVQEQLRAPQGNTLPAQEPQERLERPAPNYFTTMAPERAAQQALRQWTPAAPSGRTNAPPPPAAVSAARAAASTELHEPSRTTRSTRPVGLSEASGSSDAARAARAAMDGIRGPRFSGR
ncbi:MAG: hypothetical protein INR71_07335 [Terriglobus roseus]|nr:hypothetical protein [Terriglobus roseus]